MSRRARLELVAAVARNGVIGRGGQLPWHLPDDLKHFKALTLGHPIIMGRRTFESIGRPLPGRRSIVVSESLTRAPDGIELARSLGEAIQLAAASEGPAFVIGGGILYAAALPHVTTLHLTEVDADVEGDAFFPEYDKARWKLTSQSAHPQDERHAMGFRISRYDWKP